MRKCIQRVFSHPVLRGFLCACLCVQESLAFASDVYKGVGEDGIVEFSDVPGQGDSERVEIEPAPVLPFPKPPMSDHPIGEAVESAFKYARIAVTSPSTDAVLRDNSGGVTVNGVVEPRLKKDHMVVVTLNGTRVGGPQKGLVFRLTNVDRGTHAVAISVVDSAGQTVVSSAPVSFHLMRATVLAPARSR